GTEPYKATLKAMLEEKKNSLNPRVGEGKKTPESNWNGKAVVGDANGGDPEANIEGDASLEEVVTRVRQRQIPTP
ncbi:hypothetical protein SK128_015776, partial [Halocaridina rubra]